LNTLLKDDEASVLSTVLLPQAKSLDISFPNIFSLTDIVGRSTDILYLVRMKQVFKHGATASYYLSSSYINIDTTVPQ